MTGRGQPTNHKVYGEAMAVLAGDALLTLAFECFLGRGMSAPIPYERLGWIAGRIASAAGSPGLVGGQAMDVGGFSKDRQLETLEATCRLKTGRLIEVSLESGAIVAGGNDSIVSAFSRYGRALGLAFQITDDLLDVRGDATAMGKRTGKDSGRGKLTFPGILGVEESVRRAELLIEQAQAALAPFGPHARGLEALAQYVLQRNH